MSYGRLSTKTNAMSPGGSTNLGDILERVLDKGLVIAGDIRVNLLDIELLTIKLRLVIASLDTAQEVGIDWWRHDPWLNGDTKKLTDENARLRKQLESMENGTSQVHDDSSRTAEVDTHAS